MDKVDLLVKNGEVWTPGGFISADVAVSGGKVIALDASSRVGRPPGRGGTVNPIPSSA